MEITEQLLKLYLKPYEDKIAAQAQELDQLRKEPAAKYRSDDIKDLSAALPKAQAEFPIAALNKANPYFKSRYADFSAIVQATRPALTKFGLSVLQNLIDLEDGQKMLYTILMHSSGQYIESRVRIIPPKNDVQSMSSYITYMKRITYSSLLGVATGDEDDDGEAAVSDMRYTEQKGTAISTKYNPKEQSADVITKEQREELEYELAEYPDIAEMILEGFKLLSIADMPKSKFMASINRIREIKALRNGTK